MELKPLFDEIVDAIHEKDGKDDGIRAIDFPERIRKISSVSNGDFSSYNRPADWLPMPEPADNEIYMLVLVPEGGYTLIGFTVNCTGSYVVELGTVTNNEFVYISGRATRSSNNKYDSVISANNFPETTSDGFKQVMIKISGNDITQFSLADNSKRVGFGTYSIYDFRCRLPQGRKVQLGAIENSSNYTTYSLRYFSWEGSNQLTDASNMFDSLYSLNAIWNLDTSKVIDASAMFKYCYSLLHIPDIDTSKVTNMKEMFYNCYSLPDYPDLNTSLVTDMTQMFRWNICMRTPPKMDYSKVEKLDAMFYGCSTAMSIRDLNLASATTATDMFTGANMLVEVTLDPNVENWSGTNLDLSTSAMSRSALVKLFESLPTITTKKTLNVRNNYGANELTSTDKKIATDKGWTLTTS